MNDDLISLKFKHAKVSQLWLIKLKMSDRISFCLFVTFECVQELLINNLYDSKFIAQEKFDSCRYKCFQQQTVKSPFLW